MIKFIENLLIFVSLSFLSSSAVADQDAVLVTLGVWEKAQGNETLVITAKDQLSRKQRNIIDGGFTTLTQMNIMVQSGDSDSDDELTAVKTISCSVKYDAWEEYYDVATISDKPQTALLKNFDSYAERCLKTQLTDPTILKQLAPLGGTLVAELIVKQTSVREADQIKNQLIQNQSGIMKQLFAHMLGELVLSQAKTLRVSVPPHPLGANLKLKSLKTPISLPNTKKKG
jgi:hypothetical protein